MAMRRHSTADPSAVAYSYIRFSTPEQAKGDSLRRQTEATRGWCEENNVRLDESLTFQDLGKSAFLGEHRKNPDRYALAAFLKLVQEGRIARGSHLVIESLDRLTREHVRAGLMLLLGLIEAGVRIVQLSPSVLVYDEKSDEMGLMLAIVELSRGHRESKWKSDLLSAAWVQKRRLARENGTPLTHCLPAWVEERGGKLVLIPEKAAAVKRIFELSAAGYGRKLITQKFIAEGVPPIGVGVHWNGSYIGQILLDRRALGEFQPRHHNRIKDGEPISNYYPAVVSEELWLAARAGVAQRKKSRGRVPASDRINVFAGLVKNARAGDSYYCAMSSGSNGRGSRQYMLVNNGSREGRAQHFSFPYATFEGAVLSRLREIDPHEILNGDSGPDESQVLAGRLARVEAELSDAAAFMEREGFSATIGKRVQLLEAQKQELAGQLTEARLKAAHPASESWGETQSLIDALAGAVDQRDARLRLRSALRRIVDQIWILVLPRGRLRLCAAQVWFADGKKHRDYLILHRPITANGKGFRVEGGWSVRSLADAEALGPLDLRKPAHARRLEKALLVQNLDGISGD
jgi:DNA invertase Pin-like site-specific DNA recombinase